MASLGFVAGSEPRSIRSYHRARLIWRNRIGEHTLIQTCLRRELEREKAWSRIHLVPLLLAEGDRDAYRRQQAALAREREIMKDVKDWEVRELPDIRVARLMTLLTNRVSICSMLLCVCRRSLLRIRLGRAYTTIPDTDRRAVLWCCDLPGRVTRRSSRTVRRIRQQSIPFGQGWHGCIHPRRDRSMGCSSALNLRAQPDKCATSGSHDAPESFGREG